MARRRRSNRILLTPAARADLIEISDFIRQRNPEAARRVRADLQEAMRRLAAMPGLGHQRAGLADETLRFWTVYSYVIVYRPGTDPLQVLRVLHGARDIERLLEDEE